MCPRTNVPDQHTEMTFWLKTPVPQSNGTQLNRVMCSYKKKQPEEHESRCACSHTLQVTMSSGLGKIRACAHSHLASCEGRADIA